MSNPSDSPASASSRPFSVYPPLPGKPGPRPPADKPLRILIVSTPKTGNTWLKLLLSEIYGLPIVELPENPRNLRLDGLPEAWVGQQHYWLEPWHKAWLEENHIVRLTTVRHPGDVLVSLWHHLQKRGGAPSPDRRIAEHLLLDGDKFGGPATVDYVGQGLYRDLHVSIAWLRAGGTYGVRYEDLWQHPLATLTGVTNYIRPVDKPVLQRAISLCQIRRLQHVKYDRGSGFLRQGGIGGWRTTLGAEIKEGFRTWDPYPTQFAFLGYTMDEAENVRLEQSPVETEGDPFRGAERFDNGVPIAPILLRCYFEMMASGRGRWPDPLAQAPGCFFDWLVRRAEADPDPRAVPALTELALYLYSTREDVRAKFPEPFGRDRPEFANWFAFSAADEYYLDHHLVLPVFRSWAALP